jgi:histidinol-phosphate/aromatic aminotransferase/cobyric acid decarboxylase-like protein
MINQDCLINPLGTSEKVITIIQEHLHGVHKYTSPIKELFTKIAKINGVKEEQVFVTDGADGALTLIAQSIFKGKKIIIPQPCFHRYKKYPSYLKVKYELVKAKNGIFFDEEGILKKEGDILLIASPNNPTGFTISNEFLEQSLKKFEKVILDETLLLTLGGKQDHIKKFPNLIIVRSFSKLFGLAGLRVGYVISSEENIQKIKSVSTPYKVNYLGQIAALTVLDDEEYIKRTQEFVEEQRILLYGALKNENIRKSESLCYCLSLTEPQQKKIAENGINLQKNINCCYNKKEDHFFRFTIGIPKKNHSLIRALVGEQK